MIYNSAVKLLEDISVNIEIGKSFTEWVTIREQTPAGTYLYTAEITGFGDISIEIGKIIIQ